MKVSQGEKRVYELVPTGMHLGRCYMVCDLGIHEKDFQGDIKNVHEVRLAFELPATLMAEGDNAGKPFSVTQTYTASLGSKANLRKALESWRGKAFTEEELDGFELSVLVGKPCLINVVHKDSKGKTYANIGAITPLMAGTECPPLVNQAINFSLDDRGNEDILPDWLKDKINFDIPNYEVLNAKQKANETNTLQQLSTGIQAPTPPPGNYDNIDQDIPF